MWFHAEFVMPCFLFGKFKFSSTVNISFKFRLLLFFYKRIILLVQFIRFHSCFSFRFIFFPAFEKNLFYQWLNKFFFFSSFFQIHLNDLRLSHGKKKLHFEKRETHNGNGFQKVLTPIWTVPFYSFRVWKQISQLIFIKFSLPR